MNEHHENGEQSQPAEKDPYDEFEERIGNIVVWFVSTISIFCKQWRGLKFDKKLGHVIQGALLAALIVYTGYTCRISNATKKSAETAAKELELSERPWLSIENVSLNSPLIFDENGVEFTISFNIKNSGKTPAIRGFWMGQMFPQDLLMSTTLSERKENCRGILYQSSAVRDSQLAETWFPGTSAPTSDKVRIVPSAITKAFDVSKEMFSHIPSPIPDYAKGIYPLWTFCVAYRSSLSDVQYHTAYLFEIFRKDGKPIFPIPKGEIPMDELTLSPHPFWAVNTDE